MNKKGFLLAEETLKIVIAVISIGLLAFLLFSLYNNGKNAKDLEFAKESIDFLVQGINAESTLIDVYNPKGWNIGTYHMMLRLALRCSKLHNFSFQNLVLI